MIYLDHAATTRPKPKAVVEAVCTAMEAFGNASRGAHEAALGALRTMSCARAELARHFGMADSRRLIFCQNATAALNTALASIEGHIVTTEAEHNSVLRPIYRRGNYSIVPLEEKGRLSLARLEAAIEPHTAAVALTHASNVTGNVHDMEAISALCRARGVRLIVDGAQAAGLLPVFVDKWGLAAYCFSGHKSLFGPQGTGGLCLGEGFLPSAPFVGGSGMHSFSKTHPSELPDALEAGTHNAHGVAGLLEGLRYVERLGADALQKPLALSRYFVKEIRALPGVILYGDIDAELRTPVVSLNVEGAGSAELASALYERFDIAVRAGAHCAPLMHESMGSGRLGALRFSFSHANTEEDAQAAVDALRCLCTEIAEGGLQDAN